MRETKRGGGPGRRRGSPRRGQPASACRRPGFDLSDRVLGQFAEDLDVDGDLDAGETVSAVRGHGIRGELGTRVRHHERDGHLAEDVVRAPHHGHFENTGQAADRVLDLLGIDVLSPADDHVLDAVHQRQVAVLVEAPHVAGADPAVDDGLLGGLGIAQVAGHHDRPGDQHLARVSGRDLAQLVVDDLDLLPRQCQSDGARLAGPVERVDGGCAGGLGEPVALEEGDAEQLLRRPEQLPGSGSGAADGEAQRGHIGVAFRGLGHQQGVDGGDAGEVRGPDAFEGVEEARG